MGEFGGNVKRKFGEIWWNFEDDVWEDLMEF